ncbi:thioesterase family protein [Pedobacter sp. L105]|uniref:acyl-CoA thioesterase n=1 Tax=Pedobacter sp. L105 TaxID=1641871 RepID=UPI00131B48E9|nr:thioesterase family protein [Pedobacter sp. L105]
MNLKTLWHKKEIVTDKKSVKAHNHESFKYKTSIELRFADFDMMGHVNNVTYFTFLEIARTKYWTHAISWDWEKTGVIVAQASMNYLSPVYPKDQLSIYVRTSRIGDSSFDLEYLLVKHVNGDEVVCGTGKTVCVAFDHTTKKSTPIPETEKNKMVTFEQL